MKNPMNQGSLWLLHVIQYLAAGKGGVGMGHDEALKDVNVKR